MAASYRKGIAWIAYNDEPMETDAEEIAGFISTGLLADLFGKDPIDVGNAVIRFKRRNPEEFEMEGV